MSILFYSHPCLFLTCHQSRCRSLNRNAIRKLESYSDPMKWLKRDILTEYFKISPHQWVQAASHDTYLWEVHRKAPVFPVQASHDRNAIFNLHFWLKAYHKWCRSLNRNEYMPLAQDLRWMKGAERRSLPVDVCWPWSCWKKSTCWCLMQCL